MKKIKLYISLLMIGVFALSSCQYGFEDINRDYRRPTSEDLEKDGLRVGGPFTELEKSIYPCGSSGTGYVNEYQIPYTLGGACWIGYLSPSQNKWVGRGFPSYSLQPWADFTFNIMYKNTMSKYSNLIEQINGDKNQKALLDIIKVASIHKAADTFGPIPYTSAIKGNDIKVPYDAQDKVYKSMLEDLDKAVQVLSLNKVNVLPNSDMIYGGDYKKWIKFANSLMLRLSMRVVYADANLAQTYAEKAINNEYGVITNINEIAQLSQGAGIKLVNPLTIINGAYNDIRMGAEIYSYMKGYEDPRLASYFTKGKQDDGNGGLVDGYYAVFKSLPKVDLYLDKQYFSLLNVQDDTPIYIIKASEVAFLMAEAKLRGWSVSSGLTAKELYEEGIKLSFKENSISESLANSYIEDDTKVPVKYIDNVNSANNKEAVSDITIAWEDNADFETNLERIITQKYIALFPDGQEAWTEYRRTGYPKIFASSFVRTDREVNGLTGPSRMVFPTSEYQSNNENINKAIELLGGSDLGNVRLWWDKKTKE